MRTLLYLSGAVQDFSNSPGVLTRRHRFCIVVQMKIALCVTESLVAEFAARKQVPLLDQPIIVALHSPLTDLWLNHRTFPPLLVNF